MCSKIWDNIGGVIFYTKMKNSIVMIIFLPYDYKLSVIGWINKYNIYLYSEQ